MIEVIALQTWSASRILASILTITAYVIKTLAGIGLILASV